MKKQLLLFGSIFLFMLLMACHKKAKNDPAPVPIHNSIIGSWQFVSALTGPDGKKVNASGKLVYMFNADSTFKQTNNDTLQNSGNFYIRKEKSNFTGKIEESLSFISATTGVGFLITLKPDTLVITENHEAPSIYTYVRLK